MKICIKFTLLLLLFVASSCQKKYWHRAKVSVNMSMKENNILKNASNNKCYLTTTTNSLLKPDLKLFYPEKPLFTENILTKKQTGNNLNFNRINIQNNKTTPLKKNTNNIYSTTPPGKGIEQEIVSQQLGKLALIFGVASLVTFLLIMVSPVFFLISFPLAIAAIVVGILSFTKDINNITKPLIGVVFGAVVFFIDLLLMIYIVSMI